MASAGGVKASVGGISVTNGAAMAAALSFFFSWRWLLCLGVFCLSAITMAWLIVM